MWQSLRYLGQFGSLTLLTVMLAACDLFGGPDIRSRVSSDVAKATAKELVLTIADDPNATENPSGSIKMKDGYPVDLEAVASSRYVLVGWRKIGGEGSISYTKQSATKVSVVVSGGPVTIAPVVEQRPEILYGLPVGGNSNVSLNASFTVVFNREIDFSSAQKAIKLLQTGTTEVPGIFNPLSGNTGVSFKPASNLVGNINYSLRIDSQLVAAIDTTLPQYVGLFVLNSQVAFVAQQDREFFTSTSLDSSPPSGSFIIAGPSGDTVYSATGQVVYNNVSGFDDSGVAAVLPIVQVGSSTTSPLATDGRWKPYLPAMSFTFDTGITSPGQYYCFLYFKDGNDNVMSNTTADPAAKKIIYDPTAPSKTTFSIQTPLTPGFVNTTSATLTLDFNDPNVGTVKGSGQSTDGVAISERKVMSFSNAYLSTDFQTTYAYSSSKAWSLTSGADGTRTVTARVYDPLGNYTEANSSVKLDTTAPWFISTPRIANTGQNISGSSSKLTAVPVYLEYSDFNSAIGENGSGVAQVRLSSASGVASGSAYSFIDGDGTTPGSGSLTGTTSPWITVSNMGFGTMNLILTSGEGSKALTFEVKDKVGNIGSVAVTFKLDTTSPTGGGITVNNNNAFTNNYIVSIQVSHPSDPSSGGVSSGYSAVWFSNTNSAPTTTTAGWQTLTSAMSNPATYTNWALPGVNGTTYTVYAWFRDAAGNIAGPVSDSILYNNTPPAGSASISTIVYSTTSTIPVTVNATGAATGFASVQFSNDGTTWLAMLPGAISSTWPANYNFNVISGYGGSSTNGARNIWVRIYTSVGVYTESLLPYTLDNTAPVGSLAILSGAAFTNLGQGTINLNVSDVTSPTGIQVRLSNDNATWTSWSDSSPTVNFNWTTGYGATSADGTKTVYAQLKDALGNTSSISDTIVYDTTAPNISAIQLDAGAAYSKNAGGTVTITLAGASDAGSGLAQMQFSNDNISWSSLETYSATRTNWSIISGNGATSAESVKTVYARVIDGGGFVSATVSASITWDITPPSINKFRIGGSSNPSSTGKRSVDLYTTVNADNLSGVSQIQFSDSTTGDGIWQTYASLITSPQWLLPVGNGSKTVNARVMDKAGNVSAWVADSITLSENSTTITLGEIAGVYNSVTLSAPYLQTGVTSNSSLIFFVTSEGRFGYISTSSGFKFVVFNTDGSIYRQGTPAIYSGTSYDFDNGTSGTSGADVSANWAGYSFNYGAYAW